jgi:stage III sporulation protein SpoIIIAA
MNKIADAITIAAIIGAGVALIVTGHGFWCMLAVMYFFF